jgi:hypothetical protein
MTIERILQQLQACDWILDLVDLGLDHENCLKYF